MHTHLWARGPRGTHPPHVCICVRTKKGVRVKTERERAVAWPLACMCAPHTPCPAPNGNPPFFRLPLQPPLKKCDHGTAWHWGLTSLLSNAHRRHHHHLLRIVWSGLDGGRRRGRDRGGGAMGRVTLCLFCGVLLLCHSPLMICHDFQKKKGTKNQQQRCVSKLHLYALRYLTCFYFVK